MKIAIIASSKDPAGVNIRNKLIELSNFGKIDEKFDNNDVFQKNLRNKSIKLYLTNQELVFSERIDEKINADAFIFASKHRSKENMPSFAVHAIGNWAEARLGGEEKRLCGSSAAIFKELFIELNQIAKESGYEITMEATHHGPFVSRPSVFVEIGSTEKEWNDDNNGEIIAKTIINALNNENSNYKVAVGIGGPHYCSNLNKTVLRTDIALSHICPKYMLENLSEDLIKQAVDKTKEKVDFILLDWKGLGKEKQRITEMLKNLEVKRTDQVLKG
jgi:D-aminoacyl-tRNA deacylase|tara:strand:+ start:46713 stop:47537 length:825 start_codon:yes stop_codon:yes gene_type:complete